MITTILRRLQEKDLHVNMAKSIWGVYEVEYLGVIINRRGIIPQPNKVEVIRNLDAQKKHHTRAFVFMINNYRDMWQNHTHILETLMSMKGKNTKF